ncbi:MAG: O-antigen ligase family protein [Nitrospirota bacterium]
MTVKNEVPVATGSGAHRTEIFLLGSLYLFAFCLPWSKSAVTVLSAAMTLVLIAYLLIRRDLTAFAKRSLDQPLSIPFLLLFGVAVIGIVHSERLSEGLAVANKVLALPLVYIIFTAVLDVSVPQADQNKAVQRILMAFLAGVLVLDSIGFLTYFGIVGHKQYVLPLAPMNMHHIWFSNVNALAIYAAVAQLLFGKARFGERTGIGLVLLIVAALIAILLSLSRTAWFGTLLTGMAMIFIFMPRRKMFIVVLVAGIAVSLLTYRISPLVRDRVNTAFSDIAVYSSGATGTSTSLGDRFNMWRGAMRMFLSNPLFGVGTGDYNRGMASFIKAGELPEHLLQYNQPHNMYLFTLATNGLAGIAALLYAFWRVFKASLPSVRTSASRLFAFLALAATIHFMIAGLFDSLYNIFVLRYTYAFIIAMSVRAAITMAGREHEQP